MKLKDYLRQQSISLNEFAKITKIPVATLWRIYSEIGSPKAKNIKKINEATSGMVTFSDFV